MPALGVLVAEPLFLLGDGVVVSYLGTSEVAGLGAAAAILATVVNVCIFLAYGTTAAVARHMGATRPGDAVAAAADGVALATAIGLVLAIGTWLAGPSLVDLFDIPAAARAPAIDYLQVSAVGVPFMLVVLAATGVLRGLHDMRSPLLITATGAAANLALNVLLVFPAGLGIVGSALGTVLTQAVMAVIYLALLRRRATTLGGSLRPTLAGVKASLGTNLALLARTAALRVYLLFAIWVAGRLGVTALAAHTIANAVWTLLALALDALAIAAQALVAGALGADDPARARAVARRVTRLGVLYGVVVGLGLLAASPLLVPLIAPDPGVRDAIWPVVLLVAALQPLAGPVFALDGVLIGASDSVYLAWAAIACTAVFIVAALPAAVGSAGLTALWWAVGAMMLARLVPLGARVRSTAWQH
ncbi:MAG: MATE family efflux transporter [Solirubrobacteraceae bacterium]|nr:MATE family efflux transporter [Solirubrobacteraceae bacterium]